MCLLTSAYIAQFPLQLTQYHATKFWRCVTLPALAMKPSWENFTLFSYFSEPQNSYVKECQNYKNRPKSLRFPESTLGKEMLRKAIQTGKSPLTRFEREINLPYKALNLKLPKNISKNGMLEAEI